MLKVIKSLEISGKNCLPIIEGGKGIGITNGVTAGHFAKANAVGTFSGVNADYIDENGKEIVEGIYWKKEEAIQKLNYYFLYF